MFKFLVLGAVLLLQGGEILGWQFPIASHRRTIFDPMPMRPFDPSFIRPIPMHPGLPTPNFMNPIPPPDSLSTPEDITKDVDEVRNLVKKLEDLTSVISHQTPTDSSSSSSPVSELSNSMNTVGKQLSSEYVVTRGVGAHKLHLRQLSWNKARKVCIDEGGQLADIRSDSEEKIILRMLAEDSIQAAWVGYHDLFEEGDWVSVLGEPLGKSGWDRWWKKRLPNPDDLDNEDCASLMLDGGGMNDRNCNDYMPFVCKITAL